MTNSSYTRTPMYGTKIRDGGPYEAIVVNHLDVKYMGTLEVEILRYTGAGQTPERSGQLVNVKYLSPFYGATPTAGLTATDGYANTQKSYGFWAVPPDIGTRVLVVFAEGNPNYGYWIGCVQDDLMNFMIPDGRASTTKTTDITPGNLKGAKLPVGEYNKKFENSGEVDPTLFLKPYNNDFTQVLEIQGLLFDESRGTTTSSARRDIPSMVFGMSTPGPLDKRPGAPRVDVGAQGSKANLAYNRLGGHSIVMDDGDDKFVRDTPAELGPPIYKNREGGDLSGDVTIPQNELFRIRTRTGHQILLHNSEDLIYIGNSRGTAWLEMTSDGKIDIHAQDSISIMTDNDLNITAERDITMEAGRNINMKASARYSEYQENDSNGNESGRIQFESAYNYNLLVGKTGKILVGCDYHTKVARNQFNTTGEYHHIRSGKDNRLTAGAYTHILSGKEHRETAVYIHMNGPAAAPAVIAKDVIPLETINLPYVFPSIPTPVAYPSIVPRAPQHEPWPHHENMDPLTFKKDETDRESPGGLNSADRVLTPDTFLKNKEGAKSSTTVGGSGGGISSGFNNSGGSASAGGAGSGTGQPGDPTVIPETSDFSFSGDGRLGALSEKYESRGDPTVIGEDSTGGPSYGAYQIATKTGTFNEYMSFLQQRHPSVYQELQASGGAQAARSRTPAFESAWKRIMSNPAAAETQHEFIQSTHYDPAATKIANSTGVNLSTRSKTLNDVVWSTAVQHGSGGANRIFQRALERTGSTNPSDEALINAVYAERGANNGQKYFGRSTSNVRQSVVNRFRNENADAISSLRQEQGSA